MPLIYGLLQILVCTLFSYVFHLPGCLNFVMSAMPLWTAGSHKSQTPPSINIFPDVLDDGTIEKAGRSTACEMEMKKRVAVETWFPGVCFAMSMSLACIMEGYGLILIAGFFASAAFKTHFGCPKLSEGVFDCEIPVQWQNSPYRWCFGRPSDRHCAKRMVHGEIWISQNLSWGALYPHLAHYHHFLYPQSADTIGWLYSVLHPMGYLPDSDHQLRLRCLSNSNSSIFYYVDQHLLDSWSTYGRRHSMSNGQQPHRTEL